MVTASVLAADASDNEISARRLDTAGDPSSGPISIASANAFAVTAPDVALNPDGSFQIVWSTLGGGGAWIYSQRDTSRWDVMTTVPEE